MTEWITLAGLLDYNHTLQLMEKRVEEGGPRDDIFA